MLGERQLCGVVAVHRWEFQRCTPSVACVLEGRALRKGDRWVLPLLADYVEAITVDLGGPSAVSAMQARTAELAMLARGCTLLVMAQATQQGTGIAGARRSVQGRRGDLVQRKSEADLASVLSKFMSVELTALRALGLERRPREVPSLRAYLAARAETPDSPEGT